MPTPNEWTKVYAVMENDMGKRNLRFLYWTKERAEAMKESLTVSRGSNTIYFHIETWIVQ